VVRLEERLCLEKNVLVVEKTRMVVLEDGVCVSDDDVCRPDQRLCRRDEDIYHLKDGVFQKTKAVVLQDDIRFFSTKAPVRLKNVLFVENDDGSLENEVVCPKNQAV
jgi:hypothetical protein